MTKIKIEFFHDVICSFCFPMSYRMRELQKQMPEVEIIHRSFALVTDERDFDYMFGSRVKAKAEILNHWSHANQNDDLHRFNIVGMERADFLFPTSMNALLACKAAYFVGGEVAYWDVFDCLQKSLFVESKNIGDLGIIEECIHLTTIDFETWNYYYTHQNTIEAVRQDLELAKQYGIRGVPALVINGKVEISGAQSLSEIIRAIEKIMNEERSENKEVAICRLQDGYQVCK